MRRNNANANSYCVTNGVCKCHAYGNGNCKCYAYDNGNCKCNCYAYSDGNRDGNAAAYTDAKAACDAAPAPYASTAPDSVKIVPARYGEPNAISNAIGYAQHYSRSDDALIRVYDDPGSVTETHEHTGDFRER
jgi:hypothetical protein